MDTRYVVLRVVWIIDDDRSADDADGITVEECHLVKLAILTIFDVDFEFSKIRISKSNPAGFNFCGGNCSGCMIVKEEIIRTRRVCRQDTCDRTHNLRGNQR